MAGETPGIASGRQTTQPFLRSFFVVLAAPRLDESLDVRQTREPMFVEALVSEPAIERFDEGVLGRLAGFDQAQRLQLLVSSRSTSSTVAGGPAER